jgi:hypothetical protein
VWIKSHRVYVHAEGFAVKINLKTFRQLKRGIHCCDLVCGAVAVVKRWCFPCDLFVFVVVLGSCLSYSTPNRSRGPQTKARELSDSKREHLGRKSAPRPQKRSREQTKEKYFRAYLITIQTIGITVIHNRFNFCRHMASISCFSLSFYWYLLGNDISRRKQRWWYITASVIWMFLSGGSPDIFDMERKIYVHPHPCHFTSFKYQFQLADWL